LVRAEGTAVVVDYVEMAVSMEAMVPAGMAMGEVEATARVVEAWVMGVGVRVAMGSVEAEGAVAVVLAAGAVGAKGAASEAGPETAEGSVAEGSEGPEGEEA
jgi:hypothetical protein